jgi:hypothetical protein
LTQEDLTIEEMHLMPGHSRMALSGSDKSGHAIMGGIPTEADSVANPTTIQVIPYKKMNYAVFIRPESVLGPMRAGLFPVTTVVIRELIAASTRRWVYVIRLSANAT